MTTRAKLVESVVWRNRIVGYADVPPAQLLANPLNFRRHPKSQQDALSGVISDVGYVDPVLVQAGTDVILDGHLRVSLALQQNQATVPVRYADVDDAEAALILATFDPISAMAFHDTEQLALLMADIETGDAALNTLLAELSGVEVIGAEVDESLKRTTNNMQMIGKGEAVGLQMGDLMVAIDRALYEDVWEHVNGPHYAARRGGGPAIFAAGFQSLGEVEC